MIPWQAIDTILLDMDGTLLDLHFDNYFWLHYLPNAYADAQGISLNQAEEKIEQFMQQHEGTLAWYCLDHWSRLLDLPIKSLKKNLHHKIQLRPHTEEFLKQLQRSGKRLILATNAHRDSLELKMQHSGLSHYFHAQVSSHDYQAAKESPLFWQHLVAAQGIDLARSLFVDDTLRVLRAARLAGCGHLLHINQPDLQKAPAPSTEFLSISHFNEILPLACLAPEAQPN